MSKTWTIKDYGAYQLQERNSLYGMGVDHRVVSAKMEGMWTPRGKADAWKLYKRDRRRMDSKKGQSQ